MGKYYAYLGDLLDGFSKCSTRLTMGETEDLPSRGYIVTKETNFDSILKFWYAHLTIDNVTSLSPNHRNSHMPPPSIVTFS
jgi:hypothetical protein